MSPLWFSVLLVGVVLASPLADLDLSDSGNAIDDERLEAKTQQYFKDIDTTLFVGEPDEEVGARLAALTPDSKESPESLGSYFEGDILLPSSEARNGLSAATYRWPNAVIPYTITGPFTTTETANIAKAMSAFTNSTCVRFVPRTNQVDYITLQSTNTGCWSTAGRVGGQQFVNLQSPACLWYTGTIMHELNHGVGFMHEQSRDERDSFINITWANIQTGRESNFYKMTPPLYGFGVSYDYGSIMHYDPYAFSTNGQPTIIATQSLNGLTMGQRDGFSLSDIFKINRMYNCTGYRTS